MGGEGFFLAMGTAGRKKDHNDAQEQREKFLFLFWPRPNQILLHSERGQQLVTQAHSKCFLLIHSYSRLGMSTNSWSAYLCK